MTYQLQYNVPYEGACIETFKTRDEMIAYLSRMKQFINYEISYYEVTELNSAEIEKLAADRASLKQES